MPPRTAARTTITRAPAPSRTRIMVARAAPIARRVGGVALQAARDEKHTIAAVVAAAALGYADRENMLESWSLIDGVDPKAQLALALFIASKVTRSRTVAHVATGVASVAVFDMVKNRG